MNITKIISSSFRYPFRNIKKLPILFVLFVLMAIVPIGMIYDNNYIKVIGIIAFLLFILIVPGYLLSIVTKGLTGSAMLPSLDLGKNIYDAIRLMILRIAYMIVPAVVFFIVLSTLGFKSFDLLLNFQIHSFIATWGLILILILIAYLIFEFLLFFFFFRLAYLNSLPEALKVHKVITDIKNIGIINIIIWLIVMVILMSVISFVSSFVVAIPYIGFLIYLCIVIPIMESIGNYSLGLLYSNIVENDDDLNKIEMEIEMLKYSN